MSHTKQSDTVALYQHLIDGLNKRFAKSPSMVFGGASHTLAELIALLQGLLDVEQAALAARVLAHDAVLAARAKAQTARPTLRGLKKFLLATFGTSADLADFGLAPPKPPAVPSTKKRAAAVDKSHATRVARHTLGRKQRKAVTASGTAPGDGSVSAAAGGPAATAGGSASAPKA
jgi:hypothetical protein